MLKATVKKNGVDVTESFKDHSSQVLITLLSEIIPLTAGDEVVITLATKEVGFFLSEVLKILGKIEKDPTIVAYHYGDNDSYLYNPNDTATEFNEDVVKLYDGLKHQKDYGLLTETLENLKYYGYNSNSFEYDDEFEIRKTAYNIFTRKGVLTIW